MYVAAGGRLDGFSKAAIVRRASSSNARNTAVTAVQVCYSCFITFMLSFFFVLVVVSCHPSLVLVPSII